MKRLIGIFFLVFCLTTLAGCQQAETHPTGKLLFVDLFQTRYQDILSLTLPAKTENMPTTIKDAAYRNYREPLFSANGKTMAIYEENWKTEKDGAIVHLGNTLKVYKIADSIGAPEIINFPKEVISHFPEYTYSSFLSLSKDGKTAYYLEENVSPDNIFTFAVFEIDLGKKTFTLKSESRWEGNSYESGGAANSDFSKIFLKHYLDKGGYVIFDTATGKYDELKFSEYAREPEWSPDEKYFTYWTAKTIGQGDNFQHCLKIAKPKSPSNATNLFCTEIEGQEALWFHSWSPDGKHIAVVYGIPWGGEEETASIVILNVANPFAAKASAPITISSMVYPLVWSPNSKWVAFYAAPEKKPGFYAVNLDDPKMLLLYSRPEWTDIYNPEKMIKIDHIDYLGSPLWLVGWVN
jgi:hypothetical protein